MSQWYRANWRLFRSERSALAETCPLMMLSIVGPGFPLNSVVKTTGECAIAHGTYILNVPGDSEDIEYGITLWLPGKYPKSPPVMFCNDPKLPKNNIDRHILKGGQACLEVRPEIRRRWPRGASIVDFIRNLVSPFLAWQVYYDAFGSPPPWGERLHGRAGMVQYYAELLGVPADDFDIIPFIKLLSRKNQPKGHEWCPCGSGKRLRHCHYGKIIAVRKVLCPGDVLADLKLLVG